MLATFLSEQYQQGLLNQDGILICRLIKITKGGSSKGFLATIHGKNVLLGES